MKVQEFQHAKLRTICTMFKSVPPLLDIFQPCKIDAHWRLGLHLANTENFHPSCYVASLPPIYIESW